MALTATQTVNMLQDIRGLVQVAVNHVISVDAMVGQLDTAITAWCQLGTLNEAGLLALVTDPALRTELGALITRLRAYRTQVAADISSQALPRVR
jgi:hypothetical protein